VAAAAPALPPERLAWRAKRSRAFFCALTAALAASACYCDNLWALGIFWKDARAIAQWLAARKDQLARLVSAPLHCSLLSVRRP
jgi:hypothetical protein